MDRLKIPTSVALLGLSFTACEKGGDPIVGTWDATSVDGVAFPYTVEGYYGEKTVFKADLVIKSDHSGTYSSHETYSYPGEPNDVYDMAFPLSVDDDSMEPKYLIAVPTAGLALSCEVDGSTMTCSDIVDGSESRWKKRK